MAETPAPVASLAVTSSSSSSSSSACRSYFGFFPRYLPSRACAEASPARWASWVAAACECAIAAMMPISGVVAQIREDSSRESSMLAGQHEQTSEDDLQDHKLA